MVTALRSGRITELRQVVGISFLDGGEAVNTGLRPLIPDLDRLPFPAYDLLPVHRYGHSSRNHPALASIELSRGCSHECEFCILWRQMGRFRGPRLTPHLRSKSPERLLEEIRILTERFGRRYLGWVDPCFNADPKVPRRLAELLLRDGRRIGQSAWVRADWLVRDAASGALQSCVEAGLNEVYIGIERFEKEALRALKKGRLNSEVDEALHILSEQYPQVFTVGSFIYGLPGDNTQHIRSLFQGAYERPLDMRFFIPLIPLPGTQYWRPELWDSTGRSFRSFDFLPSPNGDPHKARLTMALLRCWVFCWTPGRFCGLVGSLLARHPRRRRIAWRHTARAIRSVAAGITSGLLGQNRAGGMRIPKWYEE
jgi:radical SAM superfamily enzyme YgiQ (UPF0313 family)